MKIPTTNQIFKVQNIYIKGSFKLAYLDEKSKNQLSEKSPKKSPKDWATFLGKKIAQGLKKSPKWQFIAQSGHPEKVDGICKLIILAFFYFYIFWSSKVKWGGATT